MEAKNDWNDWVSSTVDASQPRLSTHFLTKFENQNKNSLLSPIFDHAATKSDGNAPSKCLLVSKKHSGSLLMAPPFYSKNSTANKFSRMGAITMRDYMCAVWGDPVDKPKMFTAWWLDAQTRGLCYSFELVVPRMLGDHGATPDAAYLVLTTVALTSGKSSRFLSPAEVIELATRWRLPLNEVWYFPSEKAVAVEQALHQARWTLKDSQVADVLEKVGGQSTVRQSFLTHLETQGEVLEGFVLMALEVASMEKLTEYVKAYNKEMAPCHDRVLKAALALGKRCKEHDPLLEKAITTTPNGGVEIMLKDGTCVPAPEPEVIPVSGDVLWESICRAEGQVGGLFRRLRDSYKHKTSLKAYKYTLIKDSAKVSPSPGLTAEEKINETSAEIPFFDGKCRRCWKKGHKRVHCPKNKNSSYASQDTVPPSPPATSQSESTSSVTSSVGASALLPSMSSEGVLQVQIDIHDDNVFYSWPLHVASGGCASLYRGLVIQFNPTSNAGHRRKTRSKKRSAETPTDSDLDASETETDIAQSAGIESRIEMRILGIEKLKCLNYIWRTFGVRNQLSCLLSQGESQYLRRCKTGFFKNWSVPSEYQPGMLCLFEGWSKHISALSKKEKEKAFSRETYLDKLDDYLSSGSPLAQRAAGIVSGITTGNKMKAPAATSTTSVGTINSASSNPTPLSGFYVVVSNLTDQELPVATLQGLGLFKTNMLKDKPNTFTTNTWLSVKNQLPLPWMFEGSRKPARRGRGGKNQRKKKLEEVTEDAVSSLPQIALVFGPPNKVDEEAGKETGKSGAEDPRWKHILDKGPAGWQLKNPNVPLFINPHEDIQGFMKELQHISEKQAIEKDTPESKKQKVNKPMVIIVGILALPPGGGKSTFFNILQERTNAIIVSSDECTMKNKKFDSELTRVIKNASSSSKNQYIQVEQDKAAADVGSGEQIVKVIGYDKNIPDEKGFEKMLRVIRPCQSENIDLKIAIVVPSEIDSDQCWARVSKRDDSYLLSPAKMELKECEKIFNNFYKMTSGFLIKAQSFVSNQVCVTDCFFNPPNDNSAGDGVAKCTELVDKLLQGNPPLFSQSLDELEDSIFSADDSIGVDFGGGKSSGKVNWCAANVIGTSLHMTLVPPPGSRNAESEKDRPEIISRLKAKSGQKITLRASKYHLAEVKEDKSSKKEARKRVGFWEIDDVIGLEETEQYPSQRLNYHITDVGSLGTSTKPFASFEVLSEAGGRGRIGSSIGASTTGKESPQSKFMQRALELAVSAKSKNNVTSGAVLVLNDKVILEAENGVKLSGDGDVTATAETLLARAMCAPSSQNKGKKKGSIPLVPLEDRGKCTVYLSSEPDAMGVEVIKRCGIKNVVYGVLNLEDSNNLWDKSDVKAAKYLLPFDVSVEKHVSKKVRSVGDSLAASQPSEGPQSPSSIVTSQVGQWTVRTYQLTQPLSVEAIITMK